ncbi:hypothetical protein B0H11DRAFT_2011398 [Mycena galericulata]|nr:hypothetical protein B0H11DRAFT_2011398 [Mycena galericulata]
MKKETSGLNLWMSWLVRPFPTVHICAQVHSGVLKTWLTAKVEGTAPRRRDATHVKYSTLKSWRLSLSRIISKYVEEGQKKLNDSVYVSLYRHCGALTVKHNLEFLTPEKQYSGRNEVRLITESIYANCVDREWTLQLDVIVKLFFNGGWRPGSIGPGTELYELQGRYFKWKSVQIHCPSYAEYHTRLTNTALKGYNLINAKRLVLNLRSAQRPDNVIFDIAPPLLCLALERGGIKGIKTHEELLASKAVNIEWEDWFSEEPVILAGKVGGHAGCKPGVPMRSGSVTQAIQVAAQRVGINLTGYDFRRNFGDEIDTNYGESGAQTGLSHSNVKTYKNNYGRQAANLDAAGSVMQEAIVGRKELNAFEAPAFNPAVGLSKADADKLQALQNQAYRVNAMPPQLKRSTGKIIAPYAAPKLARPKIFLSDAECEAHPDWISFTKDTQWSTRAERLVELKNTLDDSLDKLPPLRKGIKMAAHIKRGYPDRPDVMATFLEYSRVKNIHDAARRRKLREIRGAADAKASATTSEDTQEMRAARAAQFAEPSAMLDIALHYAPSFKVGPNAEKDTTDDVPLDDLIDPNFKEFEEGDPTQVDVDEFPAWIARAGYIKMMATLGTDVHTLCPKCQIDPTVSEEDRERVWTPWRLTRHILQFHTLSCQWVRWYKKHKTCFLCALDGIVKKFKCRSTFTRHINKVNGHHRDDPRMPKETPKVEVPIKLPTSFLSPQVTVESEAHWLNTLSKVEMPSTFLSTTEMEDVVTGSTALTVDPRTMTRGIDVLLAIRNASRRKLVKQGFLFVGVEDDEL